MSNNIEKRPVLIRHQMSGVWIGYLVGEGTFPNSITVEGRRVWSWTGGRLELSQLAVQGCREGDKLGEWEEVEIGSIETQLIELRTIKESVVVASKKLAAWQE